MRHARSSPGDKEPGYALAMAAQGWKNHLYYGDNLEVLRNSIATESVDLVYLDPPFNSNRNYNVLFANDGSQRHAADASAQIEAFEDTWVWTPETERQYQQHISGGLPTRVADALTAMRMLLGENDASAYLVNMAPRLVELHRVLKFTGSLYLHCDPTMSHYLKILLDAIFDPRNFRNEIIWRRTGAHGKVRRFGPIHDVILYYVKSGEATWNGSSRPYMRKHVEEYFVRDEKGWRTNYYGNVLTGSGTRGGESGKPWKGIDPTAKGRHWAIPGKLLDGFEAEVDGLSQHEKLDFLYDKGIIKISPGDAWPSYERYITPEDGTPTGDIWAYQPYTEGTVFGTQNGVDADVRWLNPRDAERLGYPTQKPLSLLERIIAASSNPGDVVLDPFCGCGTTVDAAQKLGRRWIGIDVTYIAIDLIEKRLLATYGHEITKDYVVSGIPRDQQAALALFKQNPFDFERWAVSMIGAQPNEKQVGDRGVDGVGRFPLEGKSKRIRMGRVVVSVKGGKSLNPAMVRDLAGTVSAQQAELGVLITLETPTRGMVDAANHAGFYTHPANGQAYPAIQIITVPELLAGKKPNLPPMVNPYRQAQRLEPEYETELLFE